jgi:hypothetical protein
MEDHSIFYSRNFEHLPNWCQRLHFFTQDRKAVKRKFCELINLRSPGATHERRLEQYRDACSQFSKDAYLGFSVIRPLAGAPVGRTVLRSYKEDAGKERRLFQCTRPYKVHVAGLELSVEGLAFQQQDLGVSACATTAIWSSLHKARHVEDIGFATPAQITTLASRYALPFGRPMPSQGLSVDQMCQAVQALGLSPTLFRTKDFPNDDSTSRSYLYSAIKSGFAPILVISEKNTLPQYHAVTAAGMKVLKNHRPAKVGRRWDDSSGDMVAIFVHDDRYGPYLRAELQYKNDDLWLKLRIKSEKKEKYESWLLNYIIIPTHLKIRMSFADLRQIAVDAMESIESYRNGYIDQKLGLSATTITFDTFIMRSYRYSESLFLDNDPLRTKQLHNFVRTVVMPRYIGVVRLSAPYFGTVDVLLDTTTFLPKVNFLAILGRSPSGPYAKAVAEHLAQPTEYNCRCIA